MLRTLPGRGSGNLPGSLARCWSGRAPGISTAPPSNASSVLAATPFACRGEAASRRGRDRTVIVATLESTAVVPSNDGAIRISTDDTMPPSETHNTERKTAMKSPLSNGHGPTDRDEPARDEHADTLAAAEELRAALADAATKATRLVSLLKNGRKRKFSRSVGRASSN